MRTPHGDQQVSEHHQSLHGIWRRLTSVVVALLVVLSSPRSVRADEIRPLRYQRKWEPLATLGGAISFASLEILQKQLAPSACRWCRRNGVDRASQDALRWSNPTAASRLSDWGAFVVLPTVALGGLGLLELKSKARRATVIDAAIVLEVIVASLNLTSGFKLVTGRKRPFLYAPMSNLDRVRARDAEDNLSFYSGHTSLAFSMVAGSAMVATLRGYRYAPLLWAVGMPLAALTGYLRIAADRHFLSDVVVGSATATGLGLLIPWLHRDIGDMNMSLVMSQSQAIFTIRR